ncbi:MAG: hypothetical protein KIT84_34300 [Labilithrix sp.]|nr:hypothetical protein [Labilithrix sp.]MCW5816119.1 hypothetical protein [Labilithrix sp.]
MNKPLLSGLTVMIVVGLAAASVHGAPPTPERPLEPRIAPQTPMPKSALPAPAPPVEITCPMKVDIEHSVKTPAGFRAFSASIRDYGYNICSGTQAMAVSDMSKAVSCYYCDNRGTQLVRMDAPYPEGKSHCERVGASYRASCR